MTHQIKTLAPAIWRMIQESQKVLLHCHPHPDPDSVGSALAMAHALRGLGKAVTVIRGDSELDFAPGVFPGFETIVAKHWFEIDLSKFDLFVALDINSRERVSEKGEVIFPPTLKVILIDHHHNLEPFGQINLVEPDYPATAQILFELFELWKLKLTPEVATCLIVGLYTDTGGFKYPRVTAETFRAAAALAAAAPNFAAAIFELENNNVPERIIFDGLTLNSVETFFGGRVALAAVAYDELQARDLKPEHTHSGVANTLKSVRGWEIGVSLIEQEPGLVKLSLRTRDAKQYDLSQIAARLGGGGHSAAAGATIRSPLPEAKRLVLEAIQSTVQS
ncbi:MAG: DHH family phosphoesterase [Candidatus Vogelbacteria bacterium]|nr:DHH family phosphoesterase [Candidatus Vogelbacteria bacterium]